MIFTGRRIMLALSLLILFALAAGGTFIRSGLYNVGADAPHTKPVYALLETLRERSIARRAQELNPPDLSKGLYPAPPEIAKTGFNDAAQAFWAIKHGIKSSGMPAWGKSMTDEYIWGMVAFLKELPKLDAASYRALVASSPGHSHGGGETIEHEPASQSGNDHDPKESQRAQAPADSAVHRHSDGSTHVHPSKKDSNTAQEP